MLTNCLAACAHLSITVSEIERDIGRKSSFFHTPLAFDARIRGVPVGIAPPRLVWKNWNSLATRWWKKFRRYLYLFWRNSRTWQTHRHRMPTYSTCRPRLCIASSGKNGGYNNCKSTVIRQQFEISTALRLLSRKGKETATLIHGVLHCFFDGDLLQAQIWQRLEHYWFYWKNKRSKQFDKKRLTGGPLPG